MTADLVAQVAAEDTSVLIHPGTAEMIDTADIEAVARFLTDVRDLGKQVQQARKDAEAHLAEHARTLGAKSFEVAGMKVEIRQADDITWEIEVLEKLLDLGLPEARWNELVTQTVSTKVSATVANQIAKANDAYAEIIAKAQTRTPKPIYVSVSA